MSHSPTYLGRLDPQFRRFVNVLSVHPTSPTSSLQSLIDNEDEAATSSASSSCSGEKFPEFLTVNAYTDESWPGTQSQREVSELFLEYVNVLSSGSESSLMTDDKEIATSTATSRRQKNSQNGSNSGQHFSQERIPDDSIVDDSAFESDVCRECFSDENYCLQKQPGVSNKRHHFNRPASGSFSSEADSERNYTNRNEAVVCLQDSSDMERLPGAGAYSVRKENISSVTRLRGQNVISRSPQDTSRHMDNSIDDFNSVDSELCYSPDSVEDDCSSISSADSSFVCFALVGEQEEAKPKRKIASNVGRRHRHKIHKSGDFSRRGESDGKERDHGVMACVVTGISGGPAVRVYRDDDLMKSAERQGSETGFVRKVKEASSDGTTEMKVNTADKDVSKGSHFPRVRSKGSLGFVFGVFGTPEKPALEEDKSTRVDVSPLNAGSGTSTCDMKDVDAYRNRLPMFPGIDLQSKPSVDGKRIYQRSNDLSAIEYDTPTDNIVAKTTDKALNVRSSREERIDDISLDKPSISPEERPGLRSTREPKPLPSQGRLKKKADVTEGDKGLRSAKSVIDAEDKEQAVPLEKHSSGFTELKRDIRVKAVSKSVQDRRPRRKRNEDEQHRMKHHKVKPGDEETLSVQTDPADSQRKHDSKDVKDRFAPNRDVKMSKLSSPLYFTNRLGIGSHRDKQDSKATGFPKSRTGNLRDETFLMTGEVQENISDEYTAAESKTDLLTPVKQTIRESIEAGFVDHGTSSEELKTRLNEGDQVCPESWSGGASGTQLESHKQQQPHKDQSLAMDIAEGLQSMSGDILIKNGLPVFNLASDHSEINSKEDNFVSPFENRSENNLSTKSNSGRSQNGNSDYDYCFQDVEDEAKDNDNCDPIDHDIKDDFDDHDRAISVHATHFVLNSTPKHRKDDNVFPADGRQGITTDESVKTVITWKPGTATDQKRGVRDTNPESQVSLRNPCQPMEQSFADQHTVNEEDVTSQLREDEIVSRVYGKAQRNATLEAKRKNCQDQNQDAKYSKKVKSRSEASKKDGNLRSHSSDEFSGYRATVKSFSKKEPLKSRQESWARAVNLPKGSLGDGQPSNKETVFIAEIEESSAKPSKVDVSIGRAMEHGHSGTMDSMETTKTVEQFTPDVSPKSDVLIDNGTKNISSFPELDGIHDVARTAAQEAAKYESQGLATPEICGHDDSSLSNTSPRRFTDENLEISSNGHDSSSSTLSCSKTSSHYDIDDVVGESSASKVEGEVHQTNPTDKNEIVGGDESKWIHLPSKEEKHFLSFPSAEKVEKENLELKKRYRTTGTKIDPPISEEVEMAQDCLGGSAAGLYKTLDVSEEDSNKAKSLDGHGHSESLENEGTIQISSKQPSTITIFPDAQRPQGVSEILVVRPRKDSKNTTGKCDKSLHPFVESIEPLPVLARRQDKDSIGLIPASGGNETSKEKPSVNEDVCIVALDASEHSKDGACIAEDKADLFTTKPASVSNQVADEGNAIPVESALDLREGVFRKRNVAGNVLILDEGEKRPHDVEEVVCSYQEPEECLPQNECNPVKQISGVRNADKENSTKMESDAKSDVWLSNSLPDVTTQTEVARMSKPRGGMRELYVHVSETHMGETFTRACLEETVLELSNLDGFPLGSKIVKNDVPDWMPCSQFTHCGCLQRYLQQHSQEKERDGNQKSDTFSASLKELDTHPSLQGANPSVQHVFDKQCQVQLLEEYTQPEYKTKEIQTSLPYSVMNKECQTNESTVIVTQPEVVQQQSIECQTELPPILYASCGVQVECENIERNNQRQLQRDKKGLYTDQHCQTFPDYEMILTSSKKSQTLVSTEDFSRSPVDHRNANLHESKSSHEMSFDNRECQTSEHYILTDPNSKHNSNEAGSSDFLCLANKECQTSRDIPLATSSTQCNILPSLNVEEVLASKKIKAFQPPSCESKECQTLLDDYMILATSKHCQTSWPHSLEEIPVNCTNAGDETGTLFDSKECQTLPDRNLPQLLSKECQTLDEFASDLPGTLKGFHAHPIVVCNSKESQTTEVPMDDSRHSSLEVFETIKVESSVQSTQTEDTPLAYENRESQTTPDQDLLLSSSKICQTTELEPVTAYEEQESQTLPDGEMFLITSKESDSKECQTLPDSNLPLLLSKECQTLDEFASDLPGTLKGFHAHPIVVCNSKESQTTEVPMDDSRHSSLEVFETIKVESSVQSTQTEDTPLAYENRESQTTPDQDLLLSSSKICQTTELEPVTAYEEQESQTLPDGEMFLITSKESQTMPFHLYGLPSELPNDRYEDMGLSNIANAEVYSETSTSAQMSSRRRPATYGKSPETTEKCFFEFQTELIQTNVQLDPTPAIFSLAIDVSEKGCQTVLCNCGSCADENNFASLSSDAQKGYLFFCINAFCKPRDLSI